MGAISTALYVTPEMAWMASINIDSVLLPVVTPLSVAARRVSPSRLRWDKADGGRRTGGARVVLDLLETEYVGKVQIVKDMIR